MIVAHKCKLNSCERKLYQKGYCKTHYLRQYRGKPLEYVTKFDKRPATIDGNIAKIPLGVNGILGYAIVDKDFAHLDNYNWHVRKGYAHTKELGAMHRYIIKPEDHQFVDHINRDRLDNRTCNLRIATQSQNMANIAVTSKHGYKGVFKSKSGKWYSQIRAYGIKYCLGTYGTKEEAAIAYNKKAKELKGDYAVLNDIVGVEELVAWGY